MATNSQYTCSIEPVISIFMVDKGITKVLLSRRDKEPYKGYWVLPGRLLKNTETIEDCITDCVLEQTGIMSLYMRQCHTLSTVDRMKDDRVVAVSYIGLINPVTLLIKQEIPKNIELEWFDIDKLPKLAFDHEEIFIKTLEMLKTQITNVNTLKYLFPSDFSIPELQKTYENILNITIDRRNFRKKLLNLNIIEDTKDVSDGSKGRPAMLYRFKEDVKDITLI